MGGGGGGVVVSEGDDLCGAGDDGRDLGGGGTRWWVCYRFPGFAESSRKTSQTVSNSFSISSAMCFGQPGKEKW